MTGIDDGVFREFKKHFSNVVAQVGGGTIIIRLGTDGMVEQGVT